MVTALAGTAAFCRRAPGFTASLAGLLSLIVVFRDAVTSGFDRVMGEPLDGYIQLAIVQHWDNVRRGLEAWNVTSYFYPWPDTLGYNDGFLLVGALYSVARLVPVDPFVAQTIAFIVIRAIGFVFFALFTSEAMGIGFGGAVLGAALSTMASNLYIQSVHGQLLTVALAPLLAWLLFRAVRHVVAQRPALACTWGAAASVLFGAWLLTAFYTIWFTLFLMLLTGLALLPLARVRPLLRWPVLVIGACFILAALPFLWVYLPKAQETGGHSFTETLSYSPSLLDFVDVGRGNLLFGRLDGWIFDRVRPGFPQQSEHAIGFGPVLLPLALAGSVIAWRRRRIAPLPLAIALATIASLLLCVHVGSHTLWYGVYRFVPGASAIRVTSRFALLLTIPLIALAMLALQRLRPLLAVPLALVLVLEEFTWQSNSGMDRPTELAFLASIPPAPPGCRVFFTEGNSPHRSGTWLDDIYPHNSDAMLIAAMRALPTINGISTFEPPDWDLIRPTHSGYRREVRSYAHRHGIENATICGLNLAERVWSSGLPPPPHAAMIAVGAALPFGDTAFDEMLDRGWEAAGPVGRWTVGGEASMTFTVPPGAAGRPLRLTLHGLPIEWNDGGRPTLHLVVNGTDIVTWHPVPGRQDLVATIPAGLTGVDAIKLGLLVDRPRSPAEMGQSPDDRRLGFFVLSFRLDPL